MKIIITGPACAHDSKNDDVITDAKRLKKLDGLLYDEELCSKYIDSAPLDEIGLTGGAIRLAFVDGSLKVVTEYGSPRKLTNAELKALIGETVGQWSDGIGEGEFQHREELGMDVDVSPGSAKDVKAEQIDDGKATAAPRVNRLLSALRKNKLDVAAKLIAKGADVLAAGKYGQAPLHVVCACGYFELVRPLLERGADPRATDDEGHTPLALLGMANVPDTPENAAKIVGTAKALVEAGALVDARDTVGRTPLMWAANRSKMPLVEFLIGRGADANARDRQKLNENTVVMYAEDLDVIKALLRHGADPAVRNASGQTAWEYALVNSHIEGYEALAAALRKGARS